MSKFLKAATSGGEIKMSSKFILETLRMTNARDDRLDMDLFDLLRHIGMNVSDLHFVLHIDPPDEKTDFSRYPSLFKVFLGIAVLTKYFYPIIEQLDKLIDDEISPNNKRSKKNVESKNEDKTS